MLQRKMMNGESDEAKIRYEIWPRTETKYNVVEVGAGGGGSHVTPHGTFETLDQAQRVIDLLNGSVPAEKLMPERIIGQVINE